MSILIKGMEMPTSCGFCPLRYESDIGDACFVDNDIVTEYQKRPTDCPLVPVQPHGDLIDRDAYEYPGDLMDEPVIIPAEEGET